MTGIFDGHKIEVGSTPIDRLEEDIATQSELEVVKTALSTETTNRISGDVLLQDNINNLEAHVSNHYMHKTGNLVENVDGQKTFANDLTAGANLTVLGNLNVLGTSTTINSENMVVTDNIIFLNNGETGSSISEGIAGLSFDRGTGTNYRVIFDEGMVCLRAGFEGSEECLATKNYVDSQIGTASGGMVAVGTSSFLGNNLPREISIVPNVGVRPYVIMITPVGDANEAIGEIYVEKGTGGDVGAKFTVHNSGDAITAFTWGVGVTGVLPAASGIAGGDLSGTYPDPTVAKLQGRAVAVTAPLTGQALIWNGSAWEASASSGVPGGTASGDLGGTYPSPSVEKLRGRTVSNATPQDGEVLTYITSTASWTPQATGSLGGATTLDGLTDTDIGALASQHIIVYDTTSAKWINSELYLGLLNDVTAYTPSNGDVLTYNATTFKWEAASPSSGSGGGTIFASGSVAHTYSSTTNVYVTGMLSTDRVLVSENSYDPGVSSPGISAYPGNGYFKVSSQSPTILVDNNIRPFSYIVVRP